MAGVRQPPTPPNPDDNPGRGGRPTKLTLPMMRAIVLLLLRGNYKMVVAERVGIGWTTFKRWMQLGLEYPGGSYGEFRAAVIAAEREFETRSLDAIVAAGQQDPKHLEWILERKFPQRWGQYRGELGELKRRLKEFERRLAAEEGRGEEWKNPQPEPDETADQDSE